MILENLSEDNQKLYREIVEKITVGEVEIDKKRICEICDLLTPFLLEDIKELGILVEDILKDRLHFSRNMFGNYTR